MTQTTPLPHRQQKTWLLVADNGGAFIYNRVTAQRGLEQGHHHQEYKTWNLEPVAHVTAPDHGSVANAVANKVNDAKLRKSFDQIFIVTPPHFLGTLRPLLSRDVRDSVQMEIHKDLIHLTPADLLRALADYWPALDPAKE